MKLCMKFFGNLAFGSSSARKYLSTCVSCFQKFNVSCCARHQRVLSSFLARVLQYTLLPRNIRVPGTPDGC